MSKVPKKSGVSRNFCRSLYVVTPIKLLCHDQPSVERALGVKLDVKS